MCKIESYFGKLERIFGEIKENWECCKDEKNAHHRDFTRHVGPHSVTGVNSIETGRAPKTKVNRVFPILYWISRIG